MITLRIVIVVILVQIAEGYIMELILPWARMGGGW